ncbi:hypothetical protein FHX49_001882 [Microbacterium endophyticum]|uniref:GerMN domain-containing protein n=1 Tax=Microbacterium endophyticum TaxID=1526412 RepID=A0A7W4V4Z2_9MICO|nr:LpqB family beta-propeller domain-containing protein [Microbacterium endophyticum]MBB2976308.1 hypothetical protein [Microbacterium endophyticum]NIK35188.1 hypothetical protein [Microbacterium endophyticum]
MRVIRALYASLVTLCALALVACAGLPTSGTVNPGLPASGEETVPDFSFVVDPPQPGATAEQIVDGFIRAGSGPRQNWATARLFLSESAQNDWQPDAGVTVDVLSERKYTDASPESVTLTVKTAATVDESGVYQTTDGGSAVLPFTLEKEGGEWRISQAPDGVVLDEDQFSSVFHSYSLMYFDPTWEYLVPDIRWFPTLNAATRIADALIDGSPTPWLSGSVVSAFPENVEALPSVPEVDGVAQVELTETALSVPTDTLSRMQTQLSESLASAGVTGVQMLVSGSPLTVEPATYRSTRVDARPLAQTESGFGFLAGSDVTPVEGLSDAMADVDAKAIETAADQKSAAVLTTDVVVVRVDANAAAEDVDDRAGVIDPTIDPEGYIWSVPRDQPNAVIAVDVDGNSFEIATAWPEATEITAMQISRDGTRMAALVSENGRWSVWVAGVVRSSDGVPERLGDALAVTTLDEIGIDVGWLDSSTLGVLSGDSDGVLFTQQPVGGIATTTSAPPGVISLAGANQPGLVRLLGADGELYVRRTNWVSSASGVSVLATQQGLPSS